MKTLFFLFRYSLMIGLIVGFLSNCHHRHQDGTEHRGCGGHAEHTGHSHTGSGSGTKAGDDAKMSVTHYTPRTELFMEYPPLVSGKQAQMVAHLTVLGQRFLPIQQGKLTVSFIKNDTIIQKWVAEQTVRTGIFKPSGRVPAAGPYQLVLQLRSSQVNEDISIPSVTVYNDEAEARKAVKAAAGEEGDISFTKEQQWQILFAHQRLTQQSLQENIEVVGELRPAPGTWARLASPVSGTITSVGSGLQEGKSVKKGQFLWRVEPQLMGQDDWPSLQREAAQTKAQWEQARFQVQRLQRMAKEQAVAQWELQQALSLQTERHAQWQAAQKRLSLFQKSRRQRTDATHAITVRSPLGGTLLRYSAALGHFVSAGQEIAEIATLESLQLVAHLPEDKLQNIRDIRGAAVRLSPPTWTTLDAPVAVGAKVAAESRTLPLFFSVKNPGHLRVEQRLSVRLLGKSRTVWAIPESALLDDHGHPAVMVQVTGETFAQKRVRVGIRDRLWVEILSGVGKSERIVTHSAYDIVLHQALKQGGAGHGHAH